MRNIEALFAELLQPCSLCYCCKCSDINMMVKNILFIDVRESNKTKIKEKTLL